MRSKLAVPVEPKTPSRASSRLRQPTQANGNGDQAVDALAGRMDRALKVSEPIPQAGAARARTAGASTSGKDGAASTVAASKLSTSRVASVTRTTAAPRTATTRIASSAGPSSSVVPKAPVKRIAATRNPIASAPKAEQNRVPAPAGPSRRSQASSTAPRPTTAPSTSTAPARGAAKPVAQPGPGRPAWADFATDMPHTERASLSMRAMNEILPSLAESSKSGYKAAAERQLPAGMTMDKVKEDLETGSMAIMVLRELLDRKQLRTKRIDVEKAALSLAQRYIAFDMLSQAESCLTATRPQFFALCQVSDENAESSELARLSRYPTQPVEGVGESEILGLVQLVLYGWLCSAGGPTSSAQETLEQILPLGVPNRTSSHPLHLASRLPAPVIASTLITFYRDLPRLHPARADWLHIQQLALQAFVLACSALSASEKPHPYPPTMLWKHTLSHATARIKAGGDALVEAEQLISGTIEWADWVVETRKEDKALWFSGEKWVELMDFWIGLGKKLGKSSVIDKAFARMMASTKIASPDPDSPFIDTPEASSNNQLKPGKKPVNGALETPTITPAVQQRSADAAKTALQFNAELSSLTVLLTNHASKPTDITSPAVIAGIRTVNTAALSDTLSALSADGSDVKVLVKVLRSLEQARRGCKRLLPSAPPKADEAAEPLFMALREWLVASIEIAEDFLQSTLISLTDIGSEVKTLVLGTVENALVLAQLLPTVPEHTTTALGHYSRATKIVRITRSALSDSSYIEAIRTIAVATYNRSIPLYKAQDFKEVVQCLEPCFVEARAVLAEIAEKRDEEGIKVCADAAERILARAAEMGGIASIKIGDLHGTAMWSGRFLSASPRETLDHIVSQLTHEFGYGKDAISPQSEEATVITRAIQVLRVDILGFSTAENIQTLLDAASPINKRNVPAVAYILDRLSEEMLGEATGSAETAMVALGILCRVEEVYEELPVLRVRCVLRQLSAMIEYNLEYGQLASSLERCQAYIDDLPASTPPSVRIELSASLDMQRALTAYRNTSDAKVSIAQFTTKAVHQLQSLLIPTSNTSVEETKQTTPERTTAQAAPTTTRTKQPLGRAATTPAVGTSRPSRRTVSQGTDKTPRTPAKPISRSAATRHVSAAASPRPAPTQATPAPSWLDLPLLVEILTSLIALLGMQGLVMQRIETLKLARAMLRGKEDERLKVAFVRFSGYLAAEYASLGKYARAKVVFEGAIKVADGIAGDEGLKARLEVGLRWCAFLASTGALEKAKAEYGYLLELSAGLDTTPRRSFANRYLQRMGEYERAILARNAVAAIRQAEGDAGAAYVERKIAFRLACRRTDVSARLAVAASEPPSPVPDAGAAEQADDPFSVPSASARTASPSCGTRPAGSGTGQDEASKDEKERTAVTGMVRYYDKKYLGWRQMQAATELLDACVAHADALAMRGSAMHAEQQYKEASQLAAFLQSSVLSSRVDARLAQLNIRMRRFDVSEERLREAQSALEGVDGPENVHTDVISGDLLSKSEAEGAIEAFLRSGKEIEKLEEGFVAVDATMVTPRKAQPTVAVASPRLSRAGKDHLLPNVLAHVLRQRILLSSGQGAGGMGEDAPADLEMLMKRIQSLNGGSHTAADLLLQGQLTLIEVLNHFKTDLLTSSLAESTIAIPMSSLSNKTTPRSTTRKSAHALLARAESAFSGALSLSMSNGRSEDVRQASLSLSMLHAFQSSLGHGSEESTRVVADMLASTSALTLHRELHEMIGAKFVDNPPEEIVWPKLSSIPNSQPLDDAEKIESEAPLREYWSSIVPPLSASGPIDLSPLPPHWAVVSISITDDLSSMFVTRHQRDAAPVIFSMPFDRQSKRDVGDQEESLLFEEARSEMRDIIATSDDTSRNGRHVTSTEGRRQWWATRYGLDERLRVLLERMEEFWFGPFKSILSSQAHVTEARTAKLGIKLSKIFSAALQGAGVDMRKCSKVQLDDAVLRCFATLPASTSEEQLEDLVYFILDIYGFHGVPVAISELNIDQTCVDVKDCLREVCVETPAGSSTRDTDHMFLILDRHAQVFPWESMPSLRGRSISRVPSLPFLMDQLRLAEIVSCTKQQGSRLPSPTPVMLNGDASTPASSASSSLSSGPHTSQSTSIPVDGPSRLGVNARNGFCIINPSGDLPITEAHFEPWMTGVMSGGWKGVHGRALTELEMVSALRDHDLVVYIGHGGAEQYIRSNSLKALHRCATTMLWGCSSGSLPEQGDFDVSGTAWNYMMAGCPSLVANLWDVTDRDIDRLSTHVLKTLHLDSAHLGSTSQSSLAISRTSAHLAMSSTSKTSAQTGPGLLPLSPVSITEAVNSARDECKLKYLTGAAPVVYGLPMWMY